ncbi:hypothetical protein FN846DRAFT_908380 [Sphaerosporella brunnea]|uniref:Uncharacterized protein n=1 Tax=Sphaerosporella brunnea TaxID=1250544 RepID=A0A5J5ET48_9PEZI|nr:hypothetical protein FN846DRAFT_908380 [Sphaerosporella brunnea]
MSIVFTIFFELLSPILSLKPQFFFRALEFSTLVHPLARWHCRIARILLNVAMCTNAAITTTVKLIRHKYKTWALDINELLMQLGVWHFIDGSEPVRDLPVNSQSGMSPDLPSSDFQPQSVEPTYVEKHARFLDKIIANLPICHIKATDDWRVFYLLSNVPNSPEWVNFVTSLEFTDKAKSPKDVIVA